MAKKTVSRSVSFEKDVFKAMDSRCKRLVMSRSEYIKRLIIRDMIGEKDLVITEVPEHLAEGAGKKGR